MEKETKKVQGMGRDTSGQSLIFTETSANARIHVNMCKHICLYTALWAHM